MRTHLDPDHPTKSAWALAVGTVVVALLLAGYLWDLADRWSADPERTNAYTLISAAGGVVIFEFLRYGFTVRRRHRRAVEEQLRLRDVRVEQINELLQQIDASERMLDAVDAAVEHRVRERFLAARRLDLQERARDLLDAVDELADGERKLIETPPDLPLAPGDAALLAALLDGTESPRRSLAQELTRSMVRSIPFFGSVAVVTLDLVEDVFRRRQEASVQPAPDAEDG
jgi:hypothetical protein